MLEVQSLTVRAGTFVVRDVSIRVPAASCHVILGATGSGKTLFLESLIGLRQPVKGVIRIDGVDVTHTPVEQRGIGYVPQDLALFPHMTAKENILYAQRVRKSERQDGSLFASLVDSLGIHHILERGVAHLSGGERQRVALARAIFSGSRVLILDEPLSSLHEGLRRELWFTLKDLAKTYRLALLIVTHDLDEAFFLGDDITILLEGKVRQQGTRMELLQRPRTSEVARFLGIRNLFTMTDLMAQNDLLSGKCPELTTALRVRKPTQMPLDEEQTDFHRQAAVGIRGEDVILYADHVPLPASNLFQGSVVGVYETGTTAIVLVKPTHGSKWLECVAPIHDIHARGLVPGQDIYAWLPEDKLFLMRDG